MNFIEATDILFAHVRAEELAEELGVKVQTIRQARIKDKDFKKGYRNPPIGWERAVIKLAERHAKELSGLAKSLKASA